MRFYFPAKPGAVTFVPWAAWPGSAQCLAIRTVFAFVPLALGAHIAYQMGHLPLLPDLTVWVWPASTAVSGQELFSFGVLPVLMVLPLSMGLVLSLFCAWMIKAKDSVTRHYLPVQASLMTMCLVAAVYVLLGGT